MNTTTTIYSVEVNGSNGWIEICMPFDSLEQAVDRKNKRIESWTIEGHVPEVRIVRHTSTTNRESEVVG